jgi:type IV pilus assembly protein PilE
MRSNANERTDAMQAQRGMTLVELLTVMVVLAVLASVAIPSYRNYLIRANRSDAKSALMQVQAAQEKFYLQNNAYSDDVAAASPAGLGLADTTTNRFYTISVELEEGGQSYTASATPTTEGGQSADTKCGIFSINDIGRREVSGTQGATACWK